MYNNFHQNQPLAKATKQPRFREPASLLVVMNTHPPCLWSANNCPTPWLLPRSPFHPHSSNYIIYIDDINNLGRPRPGQYPMPQVALQRWSKHTQGPM